MTDAPCTSVALPKPSKTRDLWLPATLARLLRLLLTELAAAAAPPPPMSLAVERPRPSNSDRRLFMLARLYRFFAPRPRSPPPPPLPAGATAAAAAARPMANSAIISPFPAIRSELRRRRHIAPLKALSLIAIALPSQFPTTSFIHSFNQSIDPPSSPSPSHSRLAILEGDRRLQTTSEFGCRFVRSFVR